MCRNIKKLFNLDPPATRDEIREASLQYVRKISGFTNPSIVNRATFITAVDAIAAISRELIASLDTSAPPTVRTEQVIRLHEAAHLHIPSR